MANGNTGKKRGPYKNTTDKTGQVGHERQYIKSFWRENTVAEVMEWSSEQLDAAIADYLKRYEARQLKLNENWWYPEPMLYNDRTK